MFGNVHLSDNLKYVLISRYVPLSPNMDGSMGRTIVVVVENGNSEPNSNLSIHFMLMFLKKAWVHLSLANYV